MTISNSLRQSLQSVFYLRNNYLISQQYEGQSIVVRFSEGTNIVPSSCIQYLTHRLVIGVPNNRGTLVISTQISCREIKKTSDSIINTFFSRNLNGTLIYIDTTKGYGYYGSRDMILDSEYHPLIICGYEVKITSDSYSYVQPVCLISPEVFRREDMISKCIVKKIIPYYSETSMYCGSDEEGRSVPEGRVKIIISTEIDRFIHSAVPPLGTNVDGAMYNILENTSIS